MTAASNSDARKRQQERLREGVKELRDWMTDRDTHTMGDGGDRRSRAATAAAWENLFDNVEVVHMCPCPACNPYLAETPEQARAHGIPMYDPDGECELVAAIKQVVASEIEAHLRVGCREVERRADAEPVERLREAARVLRDETWPDYIDPGLGAALADWLDSVADAASPPEFGHSYKGRHISSVDEAHALAVADQILGRT